MNRFSKLNISYLVVCIVLLLASFGCTQSRQRDSIDAYFKILDGIKVAKKNQIIDYFNKIKQITNNAKKDNTMLRCFNVMREYYASDVTRADTSSLYRLEYETDVQFVNKSTV
jgi:hypothetical protein